MANVSEINACIETILYYHGKIQYIKKHLSRLKKSVFQLTGHKIDTNEVEAEIEKLVDSLDHGNIIIKLVYDIHKFKYTLQTRNFHYFSPNLIVGISSSIKNTSPVSWIKSTNRKLYKEVESEYIKKGLNDLIILNEFGRVCESTIANVFILKDGVYYTPPISEGCIDGVYRTVFIQKAMIKKISFKEMPLSIDDLKSADQVFLCNAVRKMYPVTVVFD